MKQASPEPSSKPFTEDARIREFGRALDALRSEIEGDLGTSDLAHITRIRSASRRLEFVGRGLLHVSFEPFGFSAGVVALWIHKCLELMEIGHMALHGAYERVSNDESLKAAAFKWKVPIDESSWRTAHNINHHQYTNIAGRDPDIDFGQLRLSPRIRHRLSHRLQPFTNVLTWFGFASVINLHVTRVLGGEDAARAAAGRKEHTAPKRTSTRAFFSKEMRYYGKEFFAFPALAGPFFVKVALGNLLSDVGRDLCAGAIIYCGHVGATDYPEGTKAGSRARWYAMQAESASNVDLPLPVSILCGALDKQIEHHLFPRLPPNRLRQIAPRVQALCKEYGVHYRMAPWPESLRAVFKNLRTMSRPNLGVAHALAA